MHPFENRSSKLETQNNSLQYANSTNYLSCISNGNRDTGTPIINPGYALISPMTQDPSHYANA